MEITNNSAVSIMGVEGQKKAQSSEETVQGTASRENWLTVGDLAKKYDMRNISPREIDQLAHELHANKLIDNNDFLTLLSRGAGFKSFEGKSFSPPDEKFDFVSSLKGQVEFSRNHGDSSESMSKILDIIVKMDVRRTIPEEGLFA